MSPIPRKQPVTPFTPTVDTDHNPTICHCCGRHAIGIGFGDASKGDPKYLCTQCVLLVEKIRSVRRMDVYELQALDGGVDRVGEWIGARGAGTDLQYYDELDRRMLVKAAVEGFGDGLRAALKEPPF